MAATDAIPIGVVPSK